MRSRGCAHLEWRWFWFGFGDSGRGWCFFSFVFSTRFGIFCFRCTFGALFRILLLLLWFLLFDWFRWFWFRWTSIAATAFCNARATIENFSFKSVDTNFVLKLKCEQLKRRAERHDKRMHWIEWEHLHFHLHNLICVNGGTWECSKMQQNADANMSWEQNVHPFWMNRRHGSMHVFTWNLSYFKCMQWSIDVWMKFVFKWNTNAVQTMYELDAIVLECKKKVCTCTVYMP